MRLRTSSVNGQRIAGVASQGLSSAGNLLLAISVAKVGTIADYSAFSITLIAYVIALGINRAVVGETLLLRHRLNGLQAEASVSLCLLIGVSTGLLSIVAGLLDVAGAGRFIFLLGLGLPGLLLEDRARYEAFSEQRPWHAAGTDALWTGLFASAVGLILLLGLAEPLTIFAAWLLTANLAALARTQCGRWPSRAAAAQYLERVRGVATNLVREFAYADGLLQGTVLIASARLAEIEAASYRAAVTFVAPAVLVLTALNMAEMNVRAGKLAQSDLKANVRRAVGYAACLAILSIGLMAVSTAIGPTVFADTWGDAAKLVVPLSLSTVVAAAATPAIVTLRVALRSVTVRRVRVYSGLFTAIAMAVGAFLEGMLGLCVAQLIGQCGATALWWGVVVRSMKRDLPSAESAGST